MRKVFLITTLLTLLTIGTAHADFTGQPLPSPTPGEAGPPPPAEHNPNAKLKDFLYSNPGLLMAIVGLKVNQKCVDYFQSVKNGSLRAHLQNQCVAATPLLVEQLDIAPSNIQDMKVVMSFHTELMHNIENPDIQNLLSNFVSDPAHDLVYLKQQLALIPNAPTWIDFIAVMFQDALPSHLNYVESHLPRGQEVVMSNYKKANRKFYDQLFTDAERATITTQDIGSMRVYHYFIIRSLSERLTRAGIDPTVSSFVSFLFNYVYKVEELVGPFQMAITEPATITKPIIIEDIYKGYLGAYAHSALIDEKTFYAMFAKDTRSALRTIAQQK